MARQLLTGGLPLLAAGWGECRALTLRDGVLTIEVPAKRLALFQDPDQQRLLASAIAGAGGVRVQLALRQVGALTDEPSDDRTRRYRAAETHPLIQDLMKRFQAELVGREVVEVEAWIARLEEQHRKKTFAGDLAGGEE